MTPKQIISSLRDKKIVPVKYMPNKQQLGAFTCSLRKNLVKKEVQNTLDSINSFLEKHSAEKVENDTGLICLQADINPEDFLVIMTSKSLLQNILNQDKVFGKTFFHVDATYKLLQNGFSLLTLGTENRSHNMRPIAIAISAHEDSNSYARFLTRIKENLEAIFDYEWKPVFAVSDAADSISKALVKTFPGIIHIRCYFHTVKAVYEKITRWKDVEEKKVLKTNWGLINYGLKLLHRTTTDDDFIQLWELIKPEWLEKYGETFVNYMINNIIENRNKLRWNRMNLIGVNLTNNALERFHLDIKTTYTKNKKLKMNEFLYIASKLIRDLSIDHKEQFTNDINIPIRIWKDALQLLKSSERGPFYNIREFYAIFVKKKRQLEKLEDREKLKTFFYDNFNSLIGFMRNIVIIQLTLFRI